MKTMARLVLAGLAVSGSAAAQMIDVDGRAIAVDGNTRFIIDDVALPAGSPAPRKFGMRVEVDAGGVQAKGIAPLAQTVVFSYALRGPVTSLAPLRVLGQEVGVNSDTVTQGLPGESFANVTLGSHLDASGYIDTNSSLLATFVEYSPTPIARWLLSGRVTAVDAAAQSAALGPQRISLAGVAIDQCGASLDVGEYVEIRADAIVGFDAASSLDSITLLRCAAPMPIGTPGALGGLHGLVAQLVSPSSFRFGPYLVQWDDATEFRFGGPDDLAPGADLEVDGVFGIGDTFAAQGIQFNVPAIRLEGPVQPGDVVAGPQGSVTLLGNTVRRSAQLRDEDDVYALGLTSPRQVEVRGYLDGHELRFATRARARGAADPGDSRVGGPVERVDNAIVTVLGVALDTTDATFEDPAGAPMTREAFFAAALPGSHVEQSGSYDAATHRITGGVMALILAAPPAAARQVVALAVGTLGDPDQVFSDGFE
jgi:hypothetical protein